MCSFYGAMISLTKTQRELTRHLIRSSMQSRKQLALHSSVNPVTTCTTRLWANTWTLSTKRQNKSRSFGPRPLVTFGSTITSLCPMPIGLATLQHTLTSNDLQLLSVTSPMPPCRSTLSATLSKQTSSNSTSLTSKASSSKSYQSCSITMP